MRWQCALWCRPVPVLLRLHCGSRLRRRLRRRRLRRRASGDALAAAVRGERELPGPRARGGGTRGGGRLAGDWFGSGLALARRLSATRGRGDARGHAPVGYAWGCVPGAHGCTRGGGCSILHPRAISYRCGLVAFWCGCAGRCMRPASLCLPQEWSEVLSQWTVRLCGCACDGASVRGRRQRGEGYAACLSIPCNAEGCGAMWNME